MNGIFRRLRPLYGGIRRVIAEATPVFFSEPAAYARRLGDAPWRSRSALPGVEMNDAGQRALLGDCAGRYRNEYDALPLEDPGRPGTFHINNGMFEGVDAEILWCMLRRHRPRTMIEIGSGYSTLLSLEALRRNEADDPACACRFTAIEPRPSRVIASGLPPHVRLLVTEVQNVPLAEFDRLRENDVLFIDSSHELRVGSDVQYEYLEILPRLHAGVIVHVHDIFLPAEYHRAWVKSDYRYLFWTEQYILQAFLAFNSGFEVLWGSSYMHLRHPDLLREAFRSCRETPRWPGSFWMRRI